MNTSAHFGVDLFIEEALRQDVKLAALLPELFKCKLVKVILHSPDVGLLQLGDRLFGGGFLLGGLSQVGLLSWSNTEILREFVAVKPSFLLAGLCRYQSCRVLQLP